MQKNYKHDTAINSGLVHKQVPHDSELLPLMEAWIAFCFEREGSSLPAILHCVNILLHFGHDVEWILNGGGGGGGNSPNDTSQSRGKGGASELPPTLMRRGSPPSVLSATEKGKMAMSSGVFSRSSAALEMVSKQKMKSGWRRRAIIGV